MTANEFAGQGGSYKVDADGRLVRAEAPTQDHPLGNRARDAQGRPLDAPPESPAAEASPSAAPGEPQPRLARRSITSVPPASTDQTKE